MENQDFLMIMNAIRTLTTKAEESLATIKRLPEPYQSSDTTELYTALAKAHTEFPPLASNKTNPWFDSPYIDIFHLSRNLYPVLGKHGLTISQPKRITEDGGTVLYTLLNHASGQWTSSRVRVIPPKNDIDSWRSTVNALRANEILSLLGLGVKDDSYDDDGEIAMLETRKAFSKAPTLKDVKTKKEDAQTITPEQRQEIELEMKDYTELADEILERCHVRSLSDIPKSQFRNAITFIRKNVQAREGR